MPEGPWPLSKHSSRHLPWIRTVGTQGLAKSPPTLGLAPAWATKTGPMGSTIPEDEFDNEHLSSASGSLMFQFEEDLEITESLESLSIPDPGLCLTCDRCDIRGIFAGRHDDRILFWDLQSTTESAERCSFCRLLAKTIGDLSCLERYSIRAQPEHFATDCTRMREARRLRLSLVSNRKPSTRRRRESRTTVDSIKELAIQLYHDDEKVLFGGRKIGERADCGLMRKWIQTCEEVHGEVCGSRSSFGNQSFHLRAIDLESNCITAMPPGARYVALSYVWGRVKQARLTRDNIEFLTLYGALESKTAVSTTQPQPHTPPIQLPRTIRDAMAVCRQLGERYLWIDSLCILQDDICDKGEQIAHMDSIYQNAIFTIVDAAGEDCEHGLAGVSERRPISHTASAAGKQLITVSRDVIRSMFGSKWNQRGWTLQEKVLSRRLLVFTPNVAFFYCSQALWREDVVLENEGHDIFLNEREMLDSQVVTDGPFTPPQSYVKVYAPLVADFLSRDLTRGEDVLNAFNGIQRTLEPHIGSFFWGLPVDFLGTALLWCSLKPDSAVEDSDEEELGSYSSSWVRSKSITSSSTFSQNTPTMLSRSTRRSSFRIDELVSPTKPIEKEPYHERRKGFPSWSWAGWMHNNNHSAKKCKLEFEQPLNVHGLPVFFSLPDLTFPKRLTETEPHYTSLHPSLRAHFQLPNADTPFHRTGLRSTCLLHLSTMKSLLAFWASTAKARITTDSLFSQSLTFMLGEDTQDYIVRTSFGLRVGTIPKREGWENPERLELEFVAVAVDSEEQLNLLLVHWDAGIAYRVPALESTFRISQDDWLAARPEQKLVILG
jgi:Heterokaryon incompatibility protein (HET)